MIRLLINNSISRLEGYNPKQEQELRKLLSYVENPHSQYATRRYLFDKKGYFPTGLLKYVEKYLLSNPYTRVDTRIRPTPSTKAPKINLKGFTPYPEQIEAAEKALKEGRGIITAVTALGKSLIASIIVDRLKVPTLVVVPNLNLRNQLIERLIGFYGVDQVGRLKENKFIAVENIDALDYKKPLKGYNCVIIDEFHHSAAKTYRKLNKHSWNDVYHRFGLTATNFRANENEKLLLESVLSQVIYDIPYTLAVAKGYVAPIEAYYIEMPEVKYEGSNRYDLVYNTLVVQDKNRNQKIANIINTLKDNGKSVLCLVKQIAHGEKLQALTGISFVKGENEDNSFIIKEFNEEREKALIGTLGCIGEGTDTKPCEYVFLATTIKSKNAFYQAIGRGMRRHPGKESCKVILIKDHSHKFLLRHFQSCVKILKEDFGVIPIEVKL